MRENLLAGGPADNLRRSPCDSGQSTRTLISPGVIILKTDATQIKLHSYRAKVWWAITRKRINSRVQGYKH